jgi:hypothetical protein
MTGVPTVTWFREYEGRPDWQPLGDQHRSFLGLRQENGITGISNAEVLDAVSVFLNEELRHPSGIR